MNNDGTPIETIESIEPGAAGAPEGIPAVEPTSDEVANMYKELGIKAPVPTGKTAGRPKSTDVRDKDDNKDDGKSAKSGRKVEADGGEGKSKDAPDSDKNGASGDDSDEKGSKVGKDSGKVPEKPEDADKGILDDKSKSDKDSERKGEGDSDKGDDGAGQDADKSDDSEEEDEDDEKGKRPGKSNPEVEKRFQKLTAEIKARDELIAKQAKELEDSKQKQAESLISQEDPAYTIDDFRKVRDEDGNILDLDANQAELAYRRWKDGYDQRKVEREAKNNHEKAIEQYQQEASERLMKSSVEAYDTLTSIYDSTPELNSKSDKFDKEFSDLVMPIIEDAVIYQEGTEPGNKEGLRPVIVGLKMNPSKILAAMNTIKSAKRSLPLNGIRDTVESNSNVRVTHGRSSDPTVQAANELYKELGIDKRL